MPEKCGKLGCDKEAVGKLQFTDQFHRITADSAVPLCESHVTDLQSFQKSDVDGVMAWLKSAE